MNRTRHGIASLLMVASVFFCRSHAGTASERRPFAGFTLQTLDGQSFVWKERVSAQRAVVLTFFTTWCVPCTREHPQLQKLFDRYRDRGLLIVAISSDEPGNLARVRTHALRYKLTFPVLLDSDSSITRQYNPDLTFPLTMLISPQGRIEKVYNGYLPGDEAKLEKDLLKLLEAAP